VGCCATRGLVSEMKTQSIPISRALICSDCNSVTDSPRECPACGSNALFGLWRFLPHCDSSALKMSTEPKSQDVIELERIVGL